MRASIEVADIFRAAGPGYRAARAGHLSLAQLKVMPAIEHCRTAVMGGHSPAPVARGFPPWRKSYTCRCPISFTVAVQTTLPAFQIRIFIHLAYAAGCDGGNWDEAVVPKLRPERQVLPRADIQLVRERLPTAAATGP